MDMTIYHTINWFFAFSFIGYLLECTVLSYENRRPVLNRGFGHGPFCVIYGFGALGACLILEPLAGQPVEPYLFLFPNIDDITPAKWHHNQSYSLSTTSYAHR